jgi:hypothetical protein
MQNRQCLPHRNAHLCTIAKSHYLASTPSVGTNFKISSSLQLRKDSIVFFFLVLMELETPLDENFALKLGVNSVPPLSEVA